MLLMGKSTISMAIFNSYVCLPEGIPFASPFSGKDFHHLSPGACLFVSPLPPGQAIEGSLQN
jgi:hypothetical protein